MKKLPKKSKYAKFFRCFKFQIADVVLSAILAFGEDQGIYQNWKLHLFIL